jgi:alkaline phosphatase
MLCHKVFKQRRWRLILLSFCGALVLGGWVRAAETPEHWRRQGEAAAAAARQFKPVTTRARNLILFVGDGMGISTVTAARIFEGQRLGLKGEEHSLSFETFSFTALIKTYAVDAQVADSAATMSAMMTGVKTKAGVLALTAEVIPGKDATEPGKEVPTLLELAARKGLGTGIVTTSRVTDATPAAGYAHSPNRDWESDGDLPPGTPYRDIARQLVEFAPGGGLDVVLGGGRNRFLPETATDPEYPEKRGKRRDGRDLIQEWRQRHPGGVFVWNRAQFEAVDPKATPRLLGLFETAELRFEADRERDGAGEPSLSEMTAKALAILSRKPKGFVLVVEGARIDHAHHGNNAFRALTETVEFSRAVAVAREKTDPRETLIIVTADHGQPLILGGYCTRGNPILGLVHHNDQEGNPKPTPAQDLHGRPYTALLYGLGPGYGAPQEASVPEDPTAPDYRQRAAVPLKSSTHSGEDVPLYAHGPRAHLFRGVLEQHVVFYLVREALELGKR